VEWWNGTSIWRVMTSPPSDLISPQILVSWRYLLPFLGVAVCLLETGYPLFIWPKRTRIIWLTCILGMHVMIGLTMGLYLFSLIMIILNLAAFGPGLLRAEYERTSIGPQRGFAVAGLASAASSQGLRDRGSYGLLSTGATLLRGFRRSRRRFLTTRRLLK
jgi:hypothetical protein